MQELSELDDDSKKNLGTVYPRIYLALPNTGQADVTLTLDDSPVEMPLIADLIVLYGFDLGSCFVLVARRDLARLGVTPDELHRHAIANLRALDLRVEAHQGDRTMMLTAGGDYEATLLLLPEIWESVAPMAPGRLVVSVPARDVVYFTGDADPMNLGDLRSWTSKALEQVDKPLSRALLVWTGSAWQEHTGYAS